MKNLFVHLFMTLFVLSFMACSNSMDFVLERDDSNSEIVIRLTPDVTRPLCLRICDPFLPALTDNPPSTVYYSFNSVDTVYRVDPVLIVSGNPMPSYQFDVSAVLYYNPESKTHGISYIKANIKNQDEYPHCRVIDYSISRLSYDGNSLVYTIDMSYSIPELLPPKSPIGTVPKQEFYFTSRNFIFVK